MSCIETENTLGIPFCNRQAVVIDRAQGSLVWDENGVRYLDFTSGWGVTSLGHSHPVVVDALCRQAGKVMQNPNSGFTYSVARAKLLETLVPVLPGNLTRAFFVNSGAEANDAAIKLARKITGRSLVVSAVDSFHGRTFNTLSVTGGEANVRRFPPSLGQSQFVPFGDIAALQGVLNENVAALILEPVQGEGGVRIPDSRYLVEAGRLCSQHGVLLIIDEVQTGFGRTGKLFAIEHAAGDVKPDFLTLGKGIAGGFPFAGFAVTSDVASRIERGDHGGTYCGNPLGCAVAAAVIDYLVRQDVPGQVAGKGRLLVSGLQKLARRFPGLIKDIRGVGLMTALELADDEQVADLTVACQQRGLLVTPTRNAIVRLIPDLLVSEAHIHQALGILDAACSAMVPRVAAAS